MEDEKKKGPEVPVWEKACLTIDEAAAYSNIGIGKLQKLTKKPNCPFVLYIGAKRLIKRKEFERFISDNQGNRLKIFFDVFAPLNAQKWAISEIYFLFISIIKHFYGINHHFFALSDCPERQRGNIDI